MTRRKKRHHVLATAVSLLRFVKDEFTLRQLITGALVVVTFGSIFLSEYFFPARTADEVRPIAARLKSSAIDCPSRPQADDGEKLRGKVVFWDIEGDDFYEFDNDRYNYSTRSHVNSIDANLTEDIHTIVFVKRTNISTGGEYVGPRGEHVLGARGTEIYACAIDIESTKAKWTLVRAKPEDKISVTYGASGAVPIGTIDGRLDAEDDLRMWIANVVLGTGEWN